MRPDRVSISARTLIAPIIGAICTSAVGAVLALTVIGMDRSNERLQAVRSVSGEIVELQLEMARANSALYQAVSWQGAGIEAAKVEAVIKDFQATTVQAGQRLGGDGSVSAVIWRHRPGRPWMLIPREPPRSSSSCRSTCRWPI